MLGGSRHGPEKQLRVGAVISGRAIDRPGDLDGQAAILAPSSVWATKRWPESHWSALVDALHQEGREVLMMGGPGDDVKGFHPPGTARLERGPSGRAR